MPRPKKKRYKHAQTVVLDRDVCGWVLEPHTASDAFLAAMSSRAFEPVMYAPDLLMQPSLLPHTDLIRARVNQLVHHAILARVVELTAMVVAADWKWSVGPVMDAWQALKPFRDQLPADGPERLLVVRELDNSWYTALFYTDTDWEHCA